MSDLWKRFTFNIKMIKVAIWQNVVAHQNISSAVDQLPENPFPSLAPDYLDHIIRRVRSEGYHVESLRVFMFGNMLPAEAIHQIQRWATRSGLRVSLNHEYEICFFEQA